MIELQKKTFANLKRFDNIYFFDAYNSGLIFFQIYTVKDIIDIEIDYGIGKKVKIITFCNTHLMLLKEEITCDSFGYYTDLDILITNVKEKISNFKEKVKSMKCSSKKMNAIKKLNRLTHLIKTYAPASKIYHNSLRIMTNIYDNDDIYEENV